MSLLQAMMSCKSLKNKKKSFSKRKFRSYDKFVCGMEEKEKKHQPKPGVEKPDKPTGSGNIDPGGLTQDQRDRGYYYDDAHGYRKYVPQNDEEDDDRAVGEDK